MSFDRQEPIQNAAQETTERGRRRHGSDPRFGFRQGEASPEDAEKESDGQRVIGNERPQRKTADEGERQEGQHRFR